MIQVEIGGRTVEAEVSFLTSLIYESEFSSDIVKDIYGSQREGDGEFAFESTREVGEDGEVELTTRIVGVDFTKVGWFELMRALWAAVKTADPATPGFYTWARTAKGVNLWEVREKLVEEMGDCFFRTPAAGEGA